MNPEDAKLTSRQKGDLNRLLSCLPRHVKELCLKQFFTIYCRSKGVVEEYKGWDIAYSKAFFWAQYFVGVIEILDRNCGDCRHYIDGICNLQNGVPPEEWAEATDICELWIVKEEILQCL